MSKPSCKYCERDRVRAWIETRKENHLTEAEWPRPKAPEFDDSVALARHVQRVHP